MTGSGRRGKPDRGGPYDAFVAAYSAAGGSLVSATYLGGSGDDAAFGVAVGPDGSADVAGLTSSTDFPCIWQEGAVLAKYRGAAAPVELVAYHVDHYGYGGQSTKLAQRT